MVTEEGGMAISGEVEEEEEDRYGAVMRGCVMARNPSSRVTSSRASPAFIISSSPPSTSGGSGGGARPQEGGGVVGNSDTAVSVSVVVVPFGLLIGEESGGGALPDGVVHDDASGRVSFVRFGSSSSSRSESLLKEIHTVRGEGGGLVAAALATLAATVS